LKQAVSSDRQLCEQAFWKMAPSGAFPGFAFTSGFSTELLGAGSIQAGLAAGADGATTAGAGGAARVGGRVAAPAKAERAKRAAARRITR